jgi:hypothetical protein
MAPDMGAGEPLLGANLVPGLGPVRAESLVAGTTDVLSFENIAITAGKPEKVLIKWRGRIGKFPLGGTLPITEVQTFGSLQAVKSSDFAALFGITVPDIGPVQASWREADRNGIIGVDKVKFMAGDGKTFRLSATGRVDSVIRHKEAFVDGLDLQLSVRASNTDNIFKLFGLQFPNLGAVDGRLALSGGKDQLTAQGLHLTVKSAEGFDIVAKGRVGYIGLEKAMPIRNIDDVLAYLHEPLVLEGRLNLAVDLQSRGRSSKEMASNLSGQFGFAIENGKIWRRVEMIASDALDLLFTAPAKKTYTDLNCMAGQLAFEKGIGTIEVLYLDTPGVRARGAGSVNLDSESIDIFVQPEAKRRLFKSSSAVKIKGQLNHPSATKVPSKEAAILAAQVAVPLIALPGRALGHLISLIRDDKDEESPCLQGMFKKN